MVSWKIWYIIIQFLQISDMLDNICTIPEWYTIKIEIHPLLMVKNFINSIFNCLIHNTKK